MTTIVYRDGVMAADSRAYAGDKQPIGFKRKIHKLDDGTMIGATSVWPGAGEGIIEWWKAGCPKDFKLPDSFTMLAVKANGEVYYASNSPFVSGPLSGDWWAIGSGEQYAAGALAMGATPYVAVAIASDLDAWTGGEIHELQNF